MTRTNRHTIINMKLRYKKSLSGMTFLYITELEPYMN